MKTVVYKTVDQSIMKEWNDLWEVSPFANYTNSPQWFLSVIDSFGYKDFVIITVYQKEKLIAVGALVKEKKYGLRCYTVAPADYTIGAPFLIDLSDRIVIKNFYESLKNLGNVYLENIPEDYVKATRYISGITSMRSTISLYFPVHKENNAVLIPKRSRLTNRIKDIEKDFTMNFLTGKDEGSMDIVFSIDKESSKQNKGYSVYNDKQVKTFYKKLSKNFGEKFCIHILYFKEKPIAYYIGFLVNKTYYWSQNAFISEYSQYSPGKILLVKIIDFLGEKNIDVVNFGSGDYRMKRLFTNEYTLLYQVVISDNALKGRYISNFTKIKNSAYHSLYNNVKLYSVYRKVKDLIN